MKRAAATPPIGAEPKPVQSIQNQIGVQKD